MEATVTINGHTLTNAHVMVMRVAVSSSIALLADEPDQSSLDKACLEKLREVEALLVKGYRANEDRST